MPVFYPFNVFNIAILRGFFLFVKGKTGFFPEPNSVGCQNVRQVNLLAVPPQAFQIIKLPRLL